MGPPVCFPARPVPFDKAAKRCLLYKKRISPFCSKIFPFRVDLFSEVREKKIRQSVSLVSVSMPLDYIIFYRTCL